MIRLLDCLRREDDEKFLAADSADDIRAARRVPQDDRDLPENGVAAVVAVGVIYFLEVIHVQHRDGERPAIPLCQRPLLFQTRHRMPAIEQAGQLIGDAQSFQPAVELREMRVEEPVKSAWTLCGAVLHAAWPHANYRARTRASKRSLRIKRLGNKIIRASAE